MDIMWSTYHGLMKWMCVCPDLTKYSVMLQALGQVKHTTYNKCVESGSDSKLHLVPCDPGSAQQKWVINNIHPWKS